MEERLPRKLAAILYADVASVRGAMFGRRFDLILALLGNESPSSLPSRGSMNTRDPQPLVAQQITIFCIPADRNWIAFFETKGLINPTLHTAHNGIFLGQAHF